MVWGRQQQQMASVPGRATRVGALDKAPGCGRDGRDGRASVCHVTVCRMSQQMEHSHPYPQLVFSMFCNFYFQINKLTFLYTSSCVIIQICLKDILQSKFKYYVLFYSSDITAQLFTLHYSYLKIVSLLIHQAKLLAYLCLNCFVSHLNLSTITVSCT